MTSFEHQQNTPQKLLPSKNVKEKTFLLSISENVETSISLSKSKNMEPFSNTTTNTISDMYGVKDLTTIARRDIDFDEHLSNIFNLEKLRKKTDALYDKFSKYYNLRNLTESDMCHIIQGVVMKCFQIRSYLASGGKQDLHINHERAIGFDRGNGKIIGGNCEFVGSGTTKDCTSLKFPLTFLIEVKKPTVMFSDVRKGRLQVLAELYSLLVHAYRLFSLDEAVFELCALFTTGEIQELYVIRCEDNKYRLYQVRDCSEINEGSWSYFGDEGGEEVDKQYLFDLAKKIFYMMELSDSTISTLMSREQKDIQSEEYSKFIAEVNEEAKVMKEYRSVKRENAKLKEELEKAGYSPLEIRKVVNDDDESNSNDDYFD